MYKFVHYKRIMNKVYMKSWSRAYVLCAIILVEEPWAQRCHVHFPVTESSDAAWLRSKSKFFPEVLHPVYNREDRLGKGIFWTSWGNTLWKENKLFQINWLEPSPRWILSSCLSTFPACHSRVSSGRKRAQNILAIFLMATSVPCSQQDPPVSNMCPVHSRCSEMLQKNECQGTAEEMERQILLLE